MTHNLWSSLNVKILEYLSGVSLNDLVEAHKVSGNDDKKPITFNTSKSANAASLVA
jgi:Rrf2 family iron-sulfur cluster assembly transcriptional regulator